MASSGGGGASARLQVFPTRMALTSMKIRLRGAQTGHSLLKRKSEALTKRFRAILGRIDETKRTMGQMLQTAAFSLAEMSYSAGPAAGASDFGFTVRNAVRSAHVRVRTRNENVSGVQLPVFEQYFCSASCSPGLNPPTSTAASNSTTLVGAGVVGEDPNQHQQQNTSVSSGFLDLAGLGRGGQQIARCREVYSKAVTALIGLSSLQTAFILLDDVIRATNRRVSAIEYIVIPKIENTIQYIISELDEQDREEFFRLKKVQAKKRRERTEAEAATAARFVMDTAVHTFEQQSATVFEGACLNGKGSLASKNLLHDSDEEDIIF